MGYNCFGGLGLVEKAVYFLKQSKIQKRPSTLLLMLALHIVLNQSGLITHNKKCCHFCLKTFYCFLAVWSHVTTFT